MSAPQERTAANPRTDRVRQSQSVRQSQPVPRSLTGVERVLVTHAHPDDETLATGMLLAHLVAAGVEVAVLTATRGELGEVVPGPLSGLAGTDAFSAHREGELAGALQVLGVRRHYYLGRGPARADGLAPRLYRDSGMRWVREGLAGPAEESGPDAFTAVDESEVQADLTAAVADFDPQVLISYEADGGYGHPDHVRMHWLTREVAQAAGVSFVQVVSHADDPRHAIEWVDTPEQLSVVAEALEHHRSQLTVDGVDDAGITVVHSGGQSDLIRPRYGVLAD